MKRQKARAARARRPACLLVVGLAGILAAGAGAGQTSWKATSGNWSNGAKWDHGEPGPEDDAIVSNGGTATINQNGEVCRTLSLGFYSGSGGSVRMTGGSLRAGVGVAVSGNSTTRFTQSGGTNTMTDLYIATSFQTSTGTYTLTGGNLSVGNDELVGKTGTGAFVHTGGSNTVDGELRIGYSNGSAGTYRLSGTGNLTARDSMVVGFWANATGRFEWFRSGGLSTPHMVLCSNGTLAMGYDFSVAQLVNGTLFGGTMSGLDDGTLEVTNGATARQQGAGAGWLGALSVGTGAGEGTYILTGGLLGVARDLSVGATLGAIGTFRLDGTGGASVTGAVRVGTGGGAGRFEWLRAGWLSVSHMVLGPSAVLAMGHDFDVPDLAGGTLFGGTLAGLGVATLEITNGAKATHDAGGVSVGVLRLGSGAFIGEPPPPTDGTYTLAGAGSLNVNRSVRIGADGPPGRFEWFRSGGLHTPEMVLGPGGTLAMAQDFRVDQLLNGSLFGGGLSGAGLATLEVTGGGTATQTDGWASLGALTVGSADGPGTYHFGGSGLLTVNGAVRIGADSGGPAFGAGRFEWFRPGGMLTPRMVLGSQGTLAMGHDFDVDQLAAGTLFSGELEGLEEATLEVTGGAVATHRLGQVAVGALVVGSASGSGAYLLEGGSLQGSDLIVRGDPHVAGTFAGCGLVGLTGLLINNGRVIADGFGQGRSLFMSDFDSVINLIENPPVGGTHGWFAQGGGRLTLPPVRLDAGDHRYNWGESPYPRAGLPNAWQDEFIDLVNSVQMDFRGVSQPGDLFLSLLDAEGWAPGQGFWFIGVWEPEPPEGMAFEGVDLTFRYDDDLALALGLEEDALRVFQYDAGQWRDVTTGVDPLNNWILADDIGSLSDFAVGVLGRIPEPATLAFVGLGVAGLLVRRRRGK